MHHRYSTTPHRRPSPAKQAPCCRCAQAAKLRGSPAQQGEAVADLQLDDCVAHGAGGCSARPAGSSKGAKSQGSRSSRNKMIALHMG